jgi:hypothetical protein
MAAPDFQSGQRRSHRHPQDRMIIDCCDRYLSLRRSQDSSEIRRPVETGFDHIAKYNFGWAVHFRTARNGGAGVRRQNLSAPNRQWRNVPRAAVDEHNGIGGRYSGHLSHLVDPLNRVT